MREIKFRAWNASRMVFCGKGGHGDFIIDQGEVVEYGEFSKNDSSVRYWPLMQYTGLLDADNKDIYEGDLIHLYGYGQYQAEYPFIELFYAAAENDIGSILGNIYENPELLEN
tara:strand:+ start:27 stop:365 length:339 start_codon:yes stop_codon:yes gene_type:complete